MSRPGTALPPTTAMLLLGGVSNYPTEHVSGAGWRRGEEGRVGGLGPIPMFRMGPSRPLCRPVGRWRVIPHPHISPNTASLCC